MAGLGSSACVENYAGIWCGAFSMHWCFQWCLMGVRFGGLVSVCRRCVALSHTSASHSSTHHVTPCIASRLSVPRPVRAVRTCCQQVGIVKYRLTTTQRTNTRKPQQCTLHPQSRLSEQTGERVSVKWCGTFSRLLVGLPSSSSKWFLFRE